jgi:hypothetical protein
VHDSPQLEARATGQASAKSDALEKAQVSPIMHLDSDAEE